VVTPLFSNLGFSAISAQRDVRFRLISVQTNFIFLKYTLFLVTRLNDPAATESEPAINGRPARQSPLWRRPAVLLAAVALFHVVSPLLLLGAHWWFGIDETVYLSQINAHVVAGLFSAPRARGATLIAAPVTLVTTSVAAVRLWVSALSGICLYLAFRPWLRLRPGYVVPLAALLFSTVWSVIYYAFEVMPNEWVAFGVLAACGYLILYVVDGRRRHGIAVIVTMALVALLRPSDSLYAGLALVMGALFLRAPMRRRVAAGGAVAAGIAAGLAEWVIEAYVSYGGLGARIHAAQAENGGGGVHFAGAAQARALAGPLLCRNGCRAQARVVYQLWWIALGVLVVVAAVYGVRHRQLRLVLVPILVGLGMAAQYVFGVTYAAPRFLIPAYALLSIPCAIGIGRLAHLAQSKPLKLVGATAFALALAANTALQAHVITAHIAPGARRFDRVISADARLLRTHGVTGACLVLGYPGIDANLAYAAHCTNTPTRLGAVREKIADGDRIVWNSPTAPPPRAYGLRWRKVLLPATTASSRYAYVSLPVSRGIAGATPVPA